MKIRRILLLAICCIASAFAEDTGKGTLIVTYQTGPKQERLDRIRFWLKKQGQEGQIYPKGTSYVDDLACRCRMVLIENIAPGPYTIEFSVPNADNYFENISIRDVTVTANKVVKVDQLIKLRTQETATSPLDESLPVTVLVPVGLAIMGDPFAEGKKNELPARTILISPFHMGLYAVTNSQFAVWLNRAFQNNQLQISRGNVTDLQGHLLAKTQEADPFSQIFTENSNGQPQFLPQVDKHNYPMINVTWYGAQAYCADNHFRLPTEAEWEKAAGMVPTSPEQPLKKYRYGFSRDTLDKTWANYRDTEPPNENFQVQTRPTGFYNGINKLENEVLTHQAMSPIGAYEMSGNVWEWCADWYDGNYYAQMPEKDPQGPPTGTEKVAKGGCYASLAEGVRVAERLPLAPDHADPYTGFRVAADR